MTYRISGLDPAPFRPLFALDDEALAALAIVRMIVSEKPGFPCRVALEDLDPGAEVLLLNHASIARGPYAASHAIFVGRQDEAATYEDAVPPALDRRILSLRAFDHDDMMQAAELAHPGEADAAIRRLFADPAIAYIHAHNAIRGCFAAAVERA